MGCPPPSPAVLWFVNVREKNPRIEKATTTTTTKKNNVVSCNPYVGPIPRTEISFFLLSICTDELILTPKIITFCLHFYL